MWRDVFAVSVGPISASVWPGTATEKLLGPDEGPRVVNLTTCYRAANVCDTAEVKPLRCLLHLHAWHTYHNDEGQRYQLCTRCGAYREKYTLTDYKAGSA
jgi:hypothetical protein